MTIKELQSKGYRKTTIKGLYLTNKGKIHNYTTGNAISPTKTGKAIINGKTYNLPKLILETFKKIPVRNGKTLFLNGNNKDFDYNNLEYASTGIQHTAPPESEIINAIRLYFEVPKKINTQNFWFKDHLNQIAKQRGFIYFHHNNTGFNLFVEWLQPFNKSQSKAQLSKVNGYTVRNGINTINKYLSLLINECLQDQENGLLQLMDFEPTPPTATEKNKKTNETLKNLGSKIQIPLRKANKNKYKGL
ncbi:hypothetical protein [Flavobacterium lacustre]|uniref:hypothetical protein n=1 Tax=Flavobacterium lacustre TaxID=3016339 RepID=UPI0022B5FC79|nr:hypothetical protein [Flavobacterium lacustre]